MALFGPTLRKVQSCFLLSIRHKNIALVRSSSVKYCAYVPADGKTKSVPFTSNKLFYLCVGAGSGLAVYTGVRKFSTPKPKSNTSLHLTSFLLDEMPPKPDKLASSYKNPNDKTGLKITLYQYMTCPFCCKVRAFLDFYGVSYDIVEVNSVTRSQTKWTKYRKVPFLVVEEESSGNTYQLKDSSFIISTLASYFNQSKNLDEIIKSFPVCEEKDEDDKVQQKIINKYAIMYPELPKNATIKEIMNECEWRQWVDDDLVHVLSPNVYRTFSESKQAFSWFAEAGNWKELFPKWELALVHYVGASVMYFIAKRLKKRHNLSDDVGEELYHSSNLWLNAINEKKTKFMGGDQPNLSDISVYGVLTAIQGCDAFNDLLQKTNIRVWYDNMRDATQNKLGSHHVAQIRP